MEDSDFYTTAQAAKVLRVSDAYIRQMLLSGELEGSKDRATLWAVQEGAGDRSEEGGMSLIAGKLNLLNQK